MTLREYGIWEVWIFAIFLFLFFFLYDEVVDETLDDEVVDETLDDEVVDETLGDEVVDKICGWMYVLERSIAYW